VSDASRYELSGVTVETNLDFKGGRGAERGVVALSADAGPTWTSPWRVNGEAFEDGGKSFDSFGEAFLVPSGQGGYVPEDGGRLARIDAAASLKVSGTGSDGAVFAALDFDVSDKVARQKLFVAARERSMAALADSRICRDFAKMCACDG
jgi:hypothetical protein